MVTGLVYLERKGRTINVGVMVTVVMVDGSSGGDGRVVEVGGGCRDCG